MGEKRDILLLYSTRGLEKTIWLLNEALKIAEKDPKANWRKIQDELKIGYGEACIIIDWLADNDKTEARISNHWIRSARIYVMNNKHSSLEEMQERLKLGYKSAFRIMIELQKKELIAIKPDFSFYRKKPGSTRENFISQIKKFAKKYRGRCEPELLMRTMYLDYETALNWAEYGKYELGFVWRGRWKRKKISQPIPPKKYTDSDKD